ncbi:hypothetical protein J2Z48_003121 [Croceifilum oryzae]|uniref:Phage-Barnase-EndoU-ColicinE5/D-RelE like nuclease 3 domain-containing protein n=1 Tax=Croceifilum oryzae TaxID=1553429 RepID=A0AAJ1WVD3_9BACL|nr:plasmid-related protein [Croceifilum oryzae]MDQ0418916.1 hypothetical protein [Croceifilum oryzae]
MSNQDFIVDPDSKDIQIVGSIPICIAEHFEIICDLEVKMYPGSIKHLKKRHPGIFEQYFSMIPNIIGNPDYVGRNPTEPHSIELYKMISDCMLIAIKLDPSGYLYLASMYDLNNPHTKISKRLKSGRIVSFHTLRSSLK